MDRLVYATVVGVCKSQHRFGKSVLSIYHVALRDWTPVISQARLASRALLLALAKSILILGLGVQARTAISIFKCEHGSADLVLGGLLFPRD